MKYTDWQKPFQLYLQSIMFMTLRIQSSALIPAFFGASLSEPHTSVTSLRTRVCIYAWTNHLPEILNKRV